MSSSSSSSPYVTALQIFYNSVGKSYNNMTKSIHEGGPERVVEAAGSSIKEGSWVLDLATGTGKVAFAAARKVGPSGRILGIDISDEFIGIATKTAEELHVSAYVEFLQRDVAKLDLPETYKGRWADAVTCASSFSMFPAPKPLLNILARDVVKPGGVFVADMWATHLPAKVFLDVAIPRGFEAPFNPLWFDDTEDAFRRVFEGSKFEMVRLERESRGEHKWDASSEEKMEELWKSLTEWQKWLSFGLDRLDEKTIDEIKQAWIKELDGNKNEEGFVVAQMRQWIVVAVVKE